VPSTLCGMRRLAVPVVVVALAVAAIGLLVYGVTQQGDDATIDQAIAQGRHPLAHDAALPMLGGTATRTLAAYRGKIVVLNFFASWCTPCKGEAPVLDRAQKAIVAHGGVVVGVAYDDAEPDLKRFATRYGISYPVLRDVGGNFSREYGITGVPESFVIDRSGHIVALRRYPIDDRWVRQTVLPLVERKT
jgi:cytochrome c biogenesis protein CcmG/thiol:disulfide interchange protein DsbE